MTEFAACLEKGGEILLATKHTFTMLSYFYISGSTEKRNARRIQRQKRLSEVQANTLL